jgi:hypothetical protein
VYYYYYSPHCRVFAAYEDDVPVDADAEQAEKRLYREYIARLTQDGSEYPDPMTVFFWLRRMV